MRSLRYIAIDGNHLPEDSCGPISPGPHPLIVVVGDERRDLNPEMLRNHAYREGRRQELAAADSAVIFGINHVLEWPVEVTWAIFAFILSLPGAQVRADDDHEPTDLFEAVLRAIIGHEDVAKCERGVQASIYAAALVHPANLRAACSRIASRLRDLRVTGYRATWLRNEAQQLVPGGEGETTDDDGILVSEVLPDAPGPEDAAVPPGWTLGQAGVTRGTGDDAELVIPSPMLMTRRFTELNGGGEALEIAWPRDGQWVTHIASREVVAGARTIIELAKYGAPITSNNAKSAVAYLAAYEAANLDVLPRVRIARQTGWQGDDGANGFLWGRELIRDEAAEVANETGGLIFQGIEDGDDELVDGFHPAGIPEAWREAVRPAGAFAPVRMAIYASLCVPLIAVLRTFNFVFSFAGPTTQGKTAAQSIAASVWGRPHEQGAPAAMGSWNATRFWFARAPAVLNDLPLNIDDTKRVDDPRSITHVIYDVTSGRGRGGGTQSGGLRRVYSFRTVMLSSGEAPICSYSQAGGTRSRVLELWGSPFADPNMAQPGDAALVAADSGRIGELVDTLNDNIGEHYGHLGPAFVRYLAANRDQWPAWRAHFQRLRGRYRRQAGANAVAGRMAAHLATIRMAAILAHRALDMPWNYRDAVSMLWPQLTAGASEADRAAEALRDVLSWVHSCPHEFHRFGSGSPPAQGWAGRWEPNRSSHGPDRRYLGLLPHRLDQVLREGGFEPEAIKREWWDRGWLRASAGRRMLRARIGDRNTYLVAVRQEVIEQFEEPNVEEEERPPTPRADA